MANAAVGSYIREALDVRLDLATQGPLDFIVRGDDGSDLRHFFICQIDDTFVPVHTRPCEDLLRGTSANSIDIR